MVDLSPVQKQFEKDSAAQAYLQKQLVINQQELLDLQETADELVEAKTLILTAAKATQQKLETYINGLVSLALTAVFDEDAYEFQLEFVQRRGQTETDIWFVRNGEKIKPIDASGGGAADVADIAARIAFWSLSKKTRPLFIMDQPFANLDEDRQPKALEMLRMLAEKSGIQIIMVSHTKKLIAGADREFRFASVHNRTVLQ